MAGKKAAKHLKKSSKLSSVKPLSVTGTSLTTVVTTPIVSHSVDTTVIVQPQPAPPSNPKAGYDLATSKPA